MAKTEVILALSAAVLAAASFVWLGNRWTFSALEFGIVGTILTYLFARSVPFGPKNAENTLRLGYGSENSKDMMQRVRRAYRLTPYISIFTVMLITAAVGLLARVVGSVIIAAVALAAMFFLYMLTMGVVWALRPPKRFTR